jgi:L-cystine uptake protein TcyP (sodium:dicarboxylate symporter family)
MDGSPSMFKIITCLIVFFFIAALVFIIRQKRLDLTSQSAQISAQIARKRQILWDQQTKIAAETNPQTLLLKLRTQRAASATTQAAAKHGGIMIYATPVFKGY